MNLLTKLLIIGSPLGLAGCYKSSTYEMEELSKDVLEQKGTAKDGISITVIPIPPSTSK